MSYEYICVIRDSGIVLILPIGDTIFRKHWHPIKFNAFYFNARITKIIYIGIKAVDIGFIKTIVMVPADENLKPIRQVAKPVEEIERFQLASRRCKRLCLPLEVPEDIYDIRACRKYGLSSFCVEFYNEVVPHYIFVNK